MTNDQIILFDGVCNFCNFWVNFIIDRDKNDCFRFTSLQSETGQKLLSDFGLSKTDFNTFILLEGDQYFTKSTAALRISIKLENLVRILYPLIIIPAPFRDFIYDVVVKNRYKFFGKRNICRIPTDEEKERFL